MATKPQTGRPQRARSVVLLFAALIAVIVAAVLFGLVPRLLRQETLLAEWRADVNRAPAVSVMHARRSSARDTLELPGDLEALNEAPIYARADGYLKARYVDIGDRQGQLIAELETPELDQQILQAEAALSQSRAALKQYEANIAQAQANLKLARATLDRWKPLSEKGVFSRQDWDEKQAAFEVRRADLQAAQATLATAQNAVAVNQANLQRLQQIKGFSRITAPFAGVVTARNVDAGTLITAGNGGVNREMFRIAQIDPLRIFVRVPQTFVSSIESAGGGHAELRVQQLPGRRFEARLDRISYSLDQNTRTMLAILLIPNPRAELLPGMYAQVRFAVSDAARPLVVPGDTIVSRSDGLHVAAVDAAGIVHFRKIEPGRDFGSEMEVFSGVSEGDSLIINPTDAIRDGVKVQARPAR